MSYLDPLDRQALDAIISAPLAWARPMWVALGVGERLDAALQRLDSLESRGWVACWRDLDEALVTLTPLAAAMLGVELVEFGPAELPRWRPIGERWPGVREPRCPRFRPDAIEAAGLHPPRREPRRRCRTRSLGSMRAAKALDRK